MSIALANSVGGFFQEAVDEAVRTRRSTPPNRQ